MARASFWDGSHDALLDVAFDIFGTCPLPDDDVEGFCKEAADQEDTRMDVGLLMAIEDAYGVDIPDDFCGRIWEHGLTFEELRSQLGGFAKQARITTPEERARSISYRASHKEEIKRKSRKRRRLQQKGLVTKMKRIGTASTGYTYVPDSKGVEGSGHANVSGLSRTFDFRPDRDSKPHEEKSSLRWR